MKKTVKIISAICAIVMLIGLLPIMNVSAEDAETAALVVTPSVDKVDLGDTFTLTVSIKNNPGIWSISFVMDIDTTAFEGVSYDCSTSILADGAGVTDFRDEGASFLFNRTSTDPFNNITDDGIVVVITLKAKADADLKSYTFNAVVDEKNNINIDEVIIPVSSASASVEIADIKSSVDFASVLLGTDISVKYYATVGSEDEGAQMKFTFNGKETVVNGVATGNGYEYAYTFTGIAPQCMGDNLKAELIVGENVVAEKATYSVLENCNNLLASNAATLGMTNAQFAAMKTLIADLLVYGAKAQVFNGYKTNALVDANVTGATELAAPAESVRRVWAPTEVVDGVKFNSMGVFFDYTNSMYVKFTAVDMDDETLRVKLTNKVTNDTVYYKLSDCELIDEATSTYMLKFDSISVLDYDTSYEFELEWYDAVDEEDWVRAHRIRYSVNAYVSAMCDNENTAMADLAKALYNYGVSASAFLKA